jgi:hypothetical protein
MRDVCCTSNTILDERNPRKRHHVEEKRRLSPTLLAVQLSESGCRMSHLPNAGPKSITARAVATGFEGDSGGSCEMGRKDCRIGS